MDHTQEEGRHLPPSLAALPFSNHWHCCPHSDEPSPRPVPSGLPQAPPTRLEPRCGGEGWRRRPRAGGHARSGRGPSVNGPLRRRQNWGDARESDRAQQNRHPSSAVMSHRNAQASSAFSARAFPLPLSSSQPRPLVFKPPARPPLSHAP